MASSLWQKLLSCNYPRLDPFKPTDLVPLLDKLTTTATTTIYLPYHIFGGGPYFRWQWGGQAEWQQLLFAWLGMCKLWGLETEKLCQTRSAEQFLADWCLAIPFFQRLNLLQKHAGTFLPKVLWLAACFERGCLFSKDCTIYHFSQWLLAAYSCHQRIYSTPFCFPNVCFFTGSLPQPFFQRLQATFFCKGCRQPFLQRLWPTFPTFATFFPKVLFWLESSPILFSKGATFFPKVAIFAQVLIYCFLDQFGP